MKIQLIAVGKTTSAYLKTGIDNYLSRLKHYIPTETTIIPDIKGSRSLSEAKQKDAEGQAILDNIQPGDLLVLLDEKGQEMTSRQFASYLNQKNLASVKRLVLVIGGPYGFSDAVYKRANHLISLSKMTFNHEMVRLFLVEQIYRAMTILRGEPYHHD